MYKKNYNIIKKTKGLSLFTKIYKMIKEKRIRKTIDFYITNYLLRYILLLNHFLFKRTFEIGNKRFEYMTNQYDCINSERTIELPYIYHFLSNSEGTTLEIGNVLSHYYLINHMVIDKYEVEPGVINQDILTFKPNQKFNLIVSISTMEHIGFDEAIKKPKSVDAIKRLITMLKPDGTLIITVPLRYNPEIDKMIRNNTINFAEVYYMKRISILNIWKETTLEDAFQYEYNSKYKNANAIAIMFYKR